MSVAGGSDDVVHPRLRVAVAGGVSAGVLALLTVLVVRRWSVLADSDQRIATAIHDWAQETPVAVDVARWLQTVGSAGISTIAVIATVVILMIARRWWLALTVAAVGAFAPLVANLLKPVVDRPRPVWVDPIEIYDQASFPSGHATGGIAVWMLCGIALASLVRDPALAALVALPFVVLGFAIGFSRMVLAVHWTSDVVGGWAIATLVICLAGVLFLARAERPRTQRPAG